MIVLREGQYSDALAIMPHLVREHRVMLEGTGNDAATQLGYIFSSSEDTFCLDEDGDILCLGGVVPVSGTVLTKVGYMWMGVTDRFYAHPNRVLFAKESRRWLNALKERYVALHDVCGVDDHKTAMWLRYLGFSFGEPVQSGLDGRMVYPVEWHRWA